MSKIGCQKEKNHKCLKLDVKKKKKISKIGCQKEKKHLFLKLEKTRAGSNRHSSNPKGYLKRW
jgi:hypothetical protein